MVFTSITMKIINKHKVYNLSNQIKIKYLAVFVNQTLTKMKILNGNLKNYYHLNKTMMALLKYIKSISQKISKNKKVNNSNII